MRFFWHKKNHLTSSEKDKQIAEVRKEIKTAIETANVLTAEVKKQLEKEGGVTELVFYATGGNNRGRK